MITTTQTTDEGQVFVTHESTIRSIRKSISREGASYVGISTKDDDDFAIRLDAVQRALSVQLGFDHLNWLKGATIEYRVTARVAGQEFVFRPKDTVSNEADKDGELIDILELVPSDRFLDKVDALPVYVSKPREQVVKDDDDDETLPAGAVIVDEAKAEPEEAKAEPKASSGKKGSK